MKKLLICLFLIANYASASTVPTNWYSLEDIESNTLFENSNKRNSKLAEYVDQIFDFEESVLGDLETSNKNLGGWKLSGQKTDFSISKKGIFGFSAMKAASGVELKWVRESTNKNNKNVVTKDNTIVVDSQMTKEELIIELEPAIALALSSEKIENESKLRKNIITKVLESRRFVKLVEKSDTNNWTPVKLRVDLSFGVSGDVFSVVKLGADFRIRLDFKIAKNINNKSSSNTEKEEKLIKLISNLSSDVDHVIEKSDFDSSFKVDKVAFAFGVSKKTIFGLVNSSASTAGVLYFKKTSNKSLKEDMNLDGDYDLTGDQKLFPSLTKRSKFRKGLKKSVKISSFFAKRAEKKNGNWKIGEIKVAFSVSYSGIFGLTGTSGKTTASIFLKK